MERRADTCREEESTKRRGTGGRSERQREKWCDEKKRKEGKWNTKKKKKKKKKRYKEMKRWKRGRLVMKRFFAKKAEKNKEEKKCKIRRKQPKVRWTWEKVWKVDIRPLDLGAELGWCKCIGIRMQQEMRIKESSWEG